MTRMYRFMFILIIILSVIFAVSFYMVATILLKARNEKAAFEDLAKMIIETQTVQTVVSGEETLPISSPYEELKEMNPDFYGWISIEGTILNYPVMFTPDEPEYYLHHAFDKSDSQSGVPFLNGNHTEQSGNYLIYGHNMKNGTMFATLLSYAEKDFFLEHPVIHFDTPEESGKYRVMAVFYSEIYPRDVQNVFRWYNYSNLSEPSAFYEYVEQAEQLSLYDTDILPQYGDKLLTLSTCSYHKENGRFVVIGIKESNKENIR